MPIVTFPTNARVISRKWTLEVPQQINRSRFTGRRKVIGMPGTEKWLVQATVEPLATEAKARSWRAFTAALRGAENWFRFPALPSPQMSAGFANPVVQNVVAGNRAVALSTSAGIVPGMHMTINQVDGYLRLVVVVGVVGAQVSFEPYLYRDPLVSSPVEVINPFGVMSLTGGNAGWDDSNGLTSFIFDAEEAL